MFSAEVYARLATDGQRFSKAEDAVTKNKSDQAVLLLKQIVDNDGNDFQAWTALGSVYVAQEKFDDAEQAYLQSIALKPASTRASLNLGRLRSQEKKFEEAIEPLDRVIQLQPESGDAQM